MPASLGKTTMFFKTILTGVALAVAVGAPAMAQQFTTAAEVRPMLDATKARWIAVREYEGKDLLYVSHLMAWRCGLVKLRVAINGGPMQDWSLPECHLGTNAPNAITPEDGPIYIEGPLGAVQTVDVEITYDDLEVETASFQRAQVLMP